MFYFCPVLFSSVLLMVLITLFFYKPFLYSPIQYIYKKLTEMNTHLHSYSQKHLHLQLLNTEHSDKYRHLRKYHSERAGICNEGKRNFIRVVSKEKK